MGREEQTEEREVLDSIFPDEITDVSPTEYRVSIALDLPPEGEDDPPSPVLLLQVAYPEAYPDEAPRLDIQAPPNAAKHPHFDVQDDKDQLLSSLESTIEENLGMAMVFTLVTTLKESAEQLILDRRASIQAEHEAEVLKAEAEENRKFEGTKVTRETFLAWSERFKREMEEEKERLEREREEELKKKRMKEEKKLTGKELWVRGLAGNAPEEDDGEDIVEGLAKVEIK
ncbi:RWD domain-containing protein [Elsinoe fawcettii]|nr:RWD domain-containing protein [Elsinoe fawcettii]